MGIGGIIADLCGVGVAPVFPSVADFSFVSFFSSPSLAGVSLASPLA